MMDFMNDFEESPYIYEKSDIDNISNPNNLYESFKRCRKGFQWKESVQKYELNLLTNITNAYHSLENKTYKLSDPYEFILNERGHNRYIKALSVVDRVIQRSFNDNVLNPAISNRIIYDNGASQKGKGVKFSRDRFKYHLRNTYNKYGYNAYVLLIDFSKYFDNILHEELLNQFKPLMNESEYWFLDKTFHTFDIDVSYMSDEEYFSSKYRQYISNSRLKYIDPKEDGSPELYKNPPHFSSSSLHIGSSVHECLLQPDSFCLAPKMHRPTAKLGDVVEMVYNLEHDGMDRIDAIREACNKVGYYVNQIDRKIPMIIE